MFIYKTYIPEDEADASFSLSETWNLLQDVVDRLPYSASVFCRQMINCMGAWHYIQIISSSPLSAEIVKHVHQIVMHKEKHQDRKDVLVGEYRKSLAFAGYHIFAPVDVIERNMRDAIFRFHKTKRDDSIMAARNLFGKIINMHPFEDGNGRICRLIVVHVLMQMKCSLFPVLLSSFYRSGRRHYIRAVKMFERKPLMFTP